MLDLDDAAHEETTPGAAHLLIHRLACSLVGQTEQVALMPGTRTHRAYGANTTGEQFACSYGLNPAYRCTLLGGDLVVAGTGPTGEVRIVELTPHPFFVATLFLPQARSAPGAPHPLVMAFLRAAIG